MARIGLAFSLFAPINEEPNEAPITYKEPLEFNHPIEANVSYERADNPLYGGDVIAENDNSITGGTLAFNNTHLTPEERAAMLGHEKLGTGDDVDYVENDEPSPYGGFGYITSEIENGVKKFQGFWIFKTQLGLNEDNSATKTESTEWQTPTVEGKIMGVKIDATGKNRFRLYRVFTTMEAAKAWVRGKAPTQAGG